jgi:hypothetical protein
MKSFLLRLLASYLVVAVFAIGMAPKADAGFSPSQLMTAGGAAREADLQNVRSFLEMKLVGDRFAQLGFSPAEVQARLSALNDEQLHRIALKVDDLKVGGEVGVVIAVLVIILLAILILRLLRMV